MAQKNLKIGITADSSGFTKGLDQATRHLKGFDEQVGSALGKTVAQFATLTAAVGATKKVLNDIKDSTQLWGDRWNRVVEGMQSSYGTFIRQLSSGEGWNNLFANMAQAYGKGKEIANILDEVFERKISFGYAEAETNRFVSEQQLIMRDSSKSEAERKAAAQAIIDKEKELAGIKRDVWSQEARALRDRFQLQTGLNDEQTDFLVKNYNTNIDLINQSRAYLEERARLEKQLASTNAGNYAFGGGFGGAMYSGANAGEAQAALDALNAKTSDAVKGIAELTRMYDKGNDELVEGMAKAEIAVIDVDTAANNACTRANALIGSINSKVEDVTENVVVLAEQLRTVQDLGWGSTFMDLDLQAAGDKLPGLEGSAERNNPGLSLAGGGIRQTTKDLDDFIRISDQAASVIQTSLISAFDELANAIAGTGDGFSGIATAMIEPLADLAITAGTIILTTGKAIDAVTASLASFFGEGAVVAGAALVGVGVAAKAGLAALAKSGGGYSASASVASSSGSGIGSGYDTRAMKVDVSGTLTADGSKLVAVINNTKKKKDYTT